MSKLPNLKRGTAKGLDTTKCGSSWRKSWRHSWVIPDDPSQKVDEGAKLEDYYIRKTYFFNPFVTHQRFMEGCNNFCVTCSDGGEIEPDGWNPGGPRKVRLNHPSTLDDLITCEPRHIHLYSYRSATLFSLEADN